MRLDKLRIANFKNLHDFYVDFDQDTLTTVLVGRNGSGKSNLLEAIVIIFRDLDLGEPPAFKYELDYICREHAVHVDADPGRSKDTVQVSVNGTSISYREFVESTEPRYLPNYVFGYYSGSSNRLERHFERHQRIFYDQLINRRPGALRSLFYARLIHSQFVLLAFFNEDDPEILQFLRENLWIDKLESVLFVMRQPPWSSKEGDNRFWKARGEVSDLLGKIYELALAPIRIKQRINLGFRKSQTLEHLYLYLKDEDDLRKLVSSYPSQQEFFKALESTYISELLSEVRIKVRIRNTNNALTFRELSEGEQQLLMVLGLLRFTKEDESLFLLDEPDTHLNPAWSMQYLGFLERVVGNHETSHIIMTTHDPLTIASLKRSQVQIMERNPDSGGITAHYPEQDPQGMGIAGLLTSDIYGLRSQLDPITLNLLDRKRELSIKDRLSEDEAKELDLLNQTLSELDFTKVVRDPLYEPFVKAMSVIEKQRKLRASVLTPEQQEFRRRLVASIIQKLKNEQNKGE